jgi:hypothetical protein
MSTIAIQCDPTQVQSRATRGVGHVSLIAVPVLLLILAIGLVHIPDPFDGDKALFTIGAETIRHGGVLYRDFWDNKQPGIYLFFCVAGSLFGFNEAGIYAFESLYLLIFSAILVFTLARYFSSPLVAACLPLFTVAFYYGVAGPWHRAQVEAVVGFPLFLALWFAVRAEESESQSPSFLFFSGLFGGIVLVFKQMFLPILLVIWLSSILLGNKKFTQASLRVVTRSLLLVIAGASLTLLITVAYFAFHGALYDFYWTTFVLPGRVVRELWNRPFDRLVDGHRWFLQSCGPSLALAAVAISPIACKRLDSLNRSLLLWLVAGFGVIELQVQSWWQYHYVLLFVPLGILAARGVDALWTNVLSQPGSLGRAPRAVLLTLVIVLLYISPIYASILNAITLLRHGVPATMDQIREIRLRRSTEYQVIDQEIHFLDQPSSAPGSIYVCGNPLYYLLSGRRQAISLNGWALWYYFPEQQRALLDQLRKARPTYILVTPKYQEIIDERFPALGTFLDDHYRALKTGPSGVWYTLP